MPDYRGMFNRDYIGAWDLAEDQTITIVEVKAGELQNKGGKDKKPICYFENTKGVRVEKGFVMNKTNAKTVAAMYGNDTAEWTGKKITLYATTCDVGGETVDCIRVRPGVPK